jgi:hypothetical protein
MNQMKPATRAILLSCIILITGTRSFSQNIDAAIAKYAEKYPSERMYLHYDKPAYSAGETVWFKVYMMSEVLPADESKTVYIDWIDDKGTLLQHSVSPLVEAITNGQFDIPAEYKGAYIYVRAYTKWMLNFDSAFLYNKTLRIISRDASQAGPKATALPPTINFFPEGGDAIAGLSNKIAFKALDQWGDPVRVKGVILNGQGKVMDTIKTLHDGMGYFFLIPEAGATYSAKWKDERNVERTTNLPAIKNSGVSLQVSLAGVNRQFNVRFTNDMASNSDTLHIVGTMYQHQAFKIARPTTAAIRGTIPTAGLPTGILTITVFDKRWNALAERITYVNNDDYRFQPEMEVKHWGLNKRARNEIRVTVPDSLVANLSVSVTDINIGTDSSNNIISHLFLSSELKGEVYNPAYYFSSDADSVSQHLDLVMLTNGWRRFKWEDVAAGRMPKLKFARDTSYMTMSGKVYGVMPGQIVPGATIFLIVKQKDAEGKFLMAPLMPDGSFNEPSVILFDTAHVYYQFDKAKAKGLSGSSVQFMTDRLPAPALTGPVAAARKRWADTTGSYWQWRMADEANQLADRMKIKTLENVTVRSKGKTPVQLMDEKYTSGLFKGGDGYQFDLLTDPFASSALNIFQYLQGKVAGLQINTGGGTPTMQWRGGSPQLYLDEVATDADFISSLSINDVAYVKVFRPPFMGGFNGANGAIAIYTRRGNDVKPEASKGLATNKVFGYSPIREFYSPNYSSFKAGNEERDIRTTLYWNPSVMLSPQKREVVLIFYNNDVSKAFRVVIEGMTRDGRLAHVEQVME